MFKIQSQLLPAAGQMPKGTRVMACRNLRPTQSADGFALEPASTPLAAFLGGWLPFAEVPLNNGNFATVCCKGSSLAIVLKNIVLSEFELAEAPSCCIPHIGGLTVMTATKRYRLSVSASAISGREIEPLPAPQFYVVADAGLSADIGSVELSKEYAAASQLDPSDNNKLGAAANALYASLDSSARELGLWWQPVMVSAVLRDPQGNVLQLSPPVLITHPTETPFDGSVKLQSEDMTHTSAATIDAPSWRLKLRLPDDAAESYADVGSIEVVASPAMHSADISSTGTSLLRRRADAGYFCIARCAPSPVGCSQAAVEALTARAQTACSAIFTISKSQIAGGAEFSVPNLPFGDAKTDVATLRKALKQPVARVGYYENLLSAPHSFTAHRCACMGHAAVWAGLRVMPFEGYSTENFSLAQGAGAWHAYTCVHFADGHSVVKVSEGLNGAPTLFSPVLSYPSPDAVSLSIAVQSSGIIKGGTFALTPDFSGKRAIYINPQLRPIELSDSLEAFVVPAEKVPSITLPDYLAVAPSASVLAPTACARIPGVQFNVLAPANASQPSWDFGRSRFYAMTSAGIYMINVAKKFDAISLSMLDARTVEAPTAIARCGNTVYALAGKEILEIRGTSLKPLSCIEGAAALAWDAVRRELWCIPANGDSVEILCPDYNWQRYTLDISLQGALTVQLENNTYVASADAATVYSLGTYSSLLSQSVEWAAEVVASKPMGRLHRFEACVAGEVDGLLIDLRRIYLNRTLPNADLSLTLTGHIGAPLRRALFLHRCERLRILLKGNAKSNFIFSRVSCK